MGLGLNLNSTTTGVAATVPTGRTVPLRQSTPSSSTTNPAKRLRIDTAPENLSEEDYGIDDIADMDISFPMLNLNPDSTTDSVSNANTISRSNIDLNANVNSKLNPTDIAPSPLTHNRSIEKGKGVAATSVASGSTLRKRVSFAEDPQMGGELDSQQGQKSYQDRETRPATLRTTGPSNSAGDPSISHHRSSLRDLEPDVPVLQDDPVCCVQCLAVSLNTFLCSLGKSFPQKFNSDYGSSDISKCRAQTNLGFNHSHRRFKRYAFDCAISERFINLQT
jgi:hypothetical protein